MKKQSISFLAICAFVFLSLPIMAQTKAEKRKAEQAHIERLIKSKDFVFEPTSVQPTSMPSRQLTYSYSLSIKNDSVSCYLPYFGVAYSAPMDATRGPLDFSSSDFTYTTKTDRRGGTDIQITFSDIAKPRQMALSISTDGYATLYVISNNSQPISFYGKIRENVDRHGRRAASR
ncbi:MAG: hypothetical protein K0S09_2151 [Sphingobacteriaceae bacterium]|jgi:hypothetical protein|nr:hypothetical protein [Sphingobacteriaceae bacterium]